MNGDGGLYPVPDWPPKATADQLGQLSGVAIDSYGNAVIFHRGDRTWNLDTFRDAPIQCCREISWLNRL